MTLPISADLDVRLVKGNMHRRFRIETSGPAEWRVTVEASGCSPVTRIITAPDAVLTHYTAMTREVESAVRNGWTSVVLQS